MGKRRCGRGSISAMKLRPTSADQLPRARRSRSGTVLRKRPSACSPPSTSGRPFQTGTVERGELARQRGVAPAREDGVVVKDAALELLARGPRQGSLGGRDGRQAEDLEAQERSARGIELLAPCALEPARQRLP